MPENGPLKTEFDVVVVGAGAAGSLAAKELSEGGLSVVVLEAGPALDPARDFPTGKRDGAGPLERVRCALTGQPIQSRGILFSRRLRRFYVDDRQHPYVTAPDKPFHWFRGRQLGGRLLTWARLVLRMSDTQFAAAARDGVGESWPLCYADLAPYYARVERFLGVYGQADDLATVPDCELLGPWPQTAGEKAFRARLAEGLPEWPIIDARVVRHDPGRVPAGIRAGLATGNLTIRPHAVAERILLQPVGTLARGVQFVDARTRERSTVRGRAIVLCASTVETNRLLLGSACQGHERGLGNSSGTLGQYLMDHCMVYATGPASREAHSGPEPGPRDPYDLGLVHGFYMPRFQNLGERDDAPFLRGYGVQGGIGRGRAAWSLVAYGEVLPRVGNRVTLDPKRKDALGLPAPRIAYSYGPNERAMIQHMHASLREIARAGGLAAGRIGRTGPTSLTRRAVDTLARSRLYTEDGALIPGSSNHEVGGARMGSNPASSVVDPSNRLWDVPNVYVTDGACFPSCGFQNVTLTLMALTVRASQAIVRECEAGRL